MCMSEGLSTVLCTAAFKAQLRSVQWMCDQMWSNLMTDECECMRQRIENHFWWCNTKVKAALKIGLGLVVFHWANHKQFYCNKRNDTNTHFLPMTKNGSFILSFVDGNYYLFWLDPTFNDWITL